MINRLKKMMLQNEDKLDEQNVASRKIHSYYSVEDINIIKY